jgi:glycosyltransferase involved in cell wall biosynthesis
MSEARISVVIPAYNRAETIAYCLDSVCSQTFLPLEIIVVDDCSTDETVKIVNDYGRIHSLVRCVSLSKKSGAQAARNRGIREARGEWVAFQDSDDEWTPDKLEKQIAAVKLANFNPMTVVHADAWLYDHNTGERNKWRLQRLEGEVFSELLRLPGSFFPSILTTKVALEGVGLLDENVPSYQEWDTAIRLAKDCNFIHLQEPTFIYHLHSGETISKNRIKDIDGYQYVIDKHREEILNYCGIATMNNHLIVNALKAMRWGYYVKAREILAKTVGNSVHSEILQLMARWELNPSIYDISDRIIRRSSIVLEKVTKITKRVNKEKY